MRVVGKLFWGVVPISLWIVLEQFQCRIERTTYGQAFPKSLVALAGFALERVRYAKRVDEKTAR